MAWSPSQLLVTACACWFCTQRSYGSSAGWSRSGCQVITEASVRQSFAHFGPIVEVKMMVGVNHDSSWNAGSVEWCWVYVERIHSMAIQWQFSVVASIWKTSHHDVVQFRYKDGRVERLLLHHLCQYRICQCCALRWVANLGMLMDVGDVGLSTMLVQRDGFRHFKTW